MIVEGRNAAATANRQMLGDPAVVEQAEPVLQCCQRMPERLSLELHPTMQTACDPSRRSERTG